MGFLCLPREDCRETSERKPWIVDRVASTSSEPLQSPPELQQAAGLSVNGGLPGELDRVSDGDSSAPPRSKKPSVSYLPVSNRHNTACNTHEWEGQSHRTGQTDQRQNGRDTEVALKAGKTSK